jgi:hypothetical protein
LRYDYAGRSLIFRVAVDKSGAEGTKATDQEGQPPSNRGQRKSRKLKRDLLKSNRDRVLALLAHNLRANARLRLSRWRIAAAPRDSATLRR